jgi:hypothetical protein
VGSLDLLTLISVVITVSLLFTLWELLMEAPLPRTASAICLARFVCEPDLPENSDFSDIKELELP